MSSPAKSKEPSPARGSNTGSPRSAGNENDSPDVIEPANQTAEEEDEFLAQGWDATSTAASTSIGSSVYAHEYAHGRRYHSYKHGKYPIPNDDFEQNREDMKHAMIMEVTDGKLLYSPIGDNPQKIIDVGTGTGIWAIEAADQYPGAEIIGIDISPHQPTWIPPNLKFYVDDVEDDWVNGSGFDLVHFRSMALVLRDVEKAIRQSFDNLKPGGWIEFQETYGMPQCDDETMKDDDIIKRYYETCQLAMKSFGYDIDKPLYLREYLEKAGFVNVQCIIKKLPLGTWPKDKTLRLVGHYTYLALIDSLPALLAKPFANLGMSEEERQVWGAKVRQAAKETDVHRYYNYYFWFAQKPE